MLSGKLFNIQKFSLHDGPGIRTTVFFKGCPLSCRWCSNPESQNRYAELSDVMADEAFAGKEYTVDEALRVVKQDMPFYKQSGGGMTLSGGEPLCQAEFASALADGAHACGISVAVETTGMVSEETFKSFLPRADLFLFDVKHYDRALHKEGTGVYNDRILANLRRAAEAGVPLIARVPVIPHFNATVTHAKGLAELLVETGVRTVNLLPFHQFGEAKYAKLGVAYAMEGMKPLYPEMLIKYRQAFLDRGLDCAIL